MTDQRGNRSSTKQALLLAGVDELNQNGIVGFSVRRIADTCGLSPGAPYKHFHNRNEFIAAIIHYNYAAWFEKLQAVIDKYPGDYRRQLVEVLAEYVRFLVENPHFRSLLMVKDDTFDSAYEGLRSRLSDMAAEIAEKYRVSSGMDRKVFQRKTFVLRSLLYGAALMIGNGELEYSEETMDTVRAMADREFDLP